MKTPAERKALLNTLRSALGLGLTATRDEMRAAFEIELAELFRPIGDPRAQLHELAETRSRGKNLSYAKALDEVKRENPELVEQCADFYAGRA